MQRIGEIVSDLRSFAYPQQAAVGEQCLLADALTMALRFTAHERGAILVEMEVAPNLRIAGSRSQLTQVLVNLLQNAFAAVQQTANLRQPEIQINAKQTGNRIAITMIDNDIGIAQEKLPRIFDPFFTTHEVGGNSMGLGLSICHAIVEKLGGTIQIDSQPEQWTKVSLDLQAADQGNES